MEISNFTIQILFSVRPSMASANQVIMMMKYCRIITTSGLKGSAFTLPIMFTFVFSLISLFTWQEAWGNNETDRLALLEIKKAITNDPYGFFNSWNDSLHFCRWPGVQCGSDDEERVTSLFLAELTLEGTLPPHIGNLSFVTSINLQNNSFHGKLPQQFGSLVHLQHLELSHNSFHGVIPANLTRCSELKTLRLDGNKLQGTIPGELGSLSKLEILRIGTNNLTGTLPASLGNLSHLLNLGAAYNFLVGQVPETLGQLSRMTMLAMGVNQLSGTIPSSLYNLSSLQYMVFTYNNLEGSLPESLGNTLTSIMHFTVSGNSLVGTIPESFCNASQLVSINMNRNQFAGRIPNCLGKYGALMWLDVGVNNLGHNSTDGGDFDFLISLANCSEFQRLGVAENNLGGKLPDSIGNLSPVYFSQLFIEHNQIVDVPETLQNLTGLRDVDLSSNLLTDSIPSYFGKLENVQRLTLHGNGFSGRIPDSLGSLERLFELDLSSNRLEGPIPASLGKCKRLVYIDISGNRLGGQIPPEVMSLSSLATTLNLSANSLSGELPAELGKLVNLNALDVSYNDLTGEIPSSIGDCNSMEHLFLQGNSFHGTIPTTLASMKALQELDLSSNKFTGNIPPELQNVKLFQYLNLSFNDLEGEVPSEGVFSNATAISLMENPHLCGGVVQLHLPKCSTKRARASGRVNLGVTIVLPVCASILLLLCFVVVLIRKHKGLRKNQQSVEEPISEQFVRVTYRDLHKATDGFSYENLIGSGGFGTVYRGKLEQMEDSVAIKVLDMKHNQAYKSLAAECNALRNIRHRNLVKVVSFCSSLDHKGKEFKALVFEYMENGSLEKWLHGTTMSDGVNQLTMNLSLIQRLDIAIDVASAMTYLHDFCETPIVHCDLKPSNVLLDSDMVGHVSDFGQARLLSTGDTFSRSIATSTSCVKGTVGYAAPEYGMGFAVSARGDVYSYGVLILEMLTRRRPTDEMFREGMNLHSFAKLAVASPGKLGSIVDPALLAEEAARYDDGNDEMSRRTREKRMRVLQMEKVQSCLASILEVGVACSAESPEQRMNIGSAVATLQSIREMLLHR